MEKKDKKQKITIIILSILLAFFSIGFFTNLIINYIDKNTYTVEVTDIVSTTPPFEVSTYTIEITCKKNITIKVEDFSFKMEDGNYMLVNALTFNDREYQSTESFVIYPYKENKITIRKTLGYPSNSNLYFKMKELKPNQKQNFK